MKKTVMKVAGILALALAATLLAGCGKKSGTKQGESLAIGSKGVLNIFTWQDYVPPTVVEKFEKETGIKINYAYFSTNEEMLSKLEAVNGSQYDVILCSDYIIQIGLAKGSLFREIEKSRIANYGNIDPSFQGKYYDPENKYTVPYAVTFPAIVYDPAETKLPFASLADIADPSLKGNLSVVDDPRALIGAALSVNGFSYNEKDPAHLAIAEKWLKKLRPNIKAFNTDNPEDLVVNGEAKAAFCYAAQAVFALTKNPNLKIAYPSGIATGEDNFVLAKGSPNVDNAYVFLNFILDPENAALAVKWTHYESSNRYASKYLQDEIAKNLVAIAPAEVIAKSEMVQNVGEAAKIYDRIWTEFK